ncbi:MAG: sigma-70 family polymerase sigma factor [Ferruginibacter sp.]|nr:sigma-70 family polymerase sigma factor [Ferruginibacter sp.]
MELNSAIQNGTEKDFTIAYNLYHVKLYRYFLKKTKSEEVSIELVQIVFIKLWKFRHTISEDFSFDTQLFNIARTCFIDFIRQKSIQRSRTFNLNDLPDLSLTIAPDTTFEATNYFDNITRSLPPARKKVFILSRIQGLSYKEIAGHLSISINTVEDHMSKAIRQIKTITSIFVFFYFALY